MNKIVHCVAMSMVLGMAGCMQTAQYAAVNSPAQEYFQRADAVTLSGGNAGAVNTRIQEIDPWPRYVGNAYIPGNGERMADAAGRYSDTSKLSHAPPPLPLVDSSAPAGTPVVSQ